MSENTLLDVILDNIPDSVYILDQAGNYIFANSSYVDLTFLNKAELLTYNVHDFIKEKRIDFCISDIVYSQRRRVAMFQDVFGENGSERIRRQLVISTPVFDEKGEVRYIIAIVRPVETMNDYYHQAQEQSVSSVIMQNTKRKPHDFIAQSPVMQTLIDTAATMAEIDSAILITGESGTGKEVLAQYIHNSGGRRKKPITVLNCASLPPSLLEAELFGYEKGAFTGALSTGKPGYFEAADGGTLFLDEINSMPLDTQSKLLRAIETKQIQRVGSTKTKYVDFRIITATNENLLELVEKRQFRSDLYYRLNVLPINIPPLRQRKEDIKPLALYFLKYYCKKYDKNSLFTAKTLDAMLQYPWPGNVRELKNFVERTVIMSIEGYIDITTIEMVRHDGNSRQHISARDPAMETLGVHDYDQMLNEGISLNEYLKRCGDAYVKYALNTCKSTYEAATALRTSQSSIMRRKRHLK